MSDARAKLAELAAEPPERWPALVAAAFPDDAALREQALLWLTADRDALAAEHAPTELDDRYRLAHRLDAGASGAVWQAFDRKLGRLVAIKLFHVQDARVVGAALAEARVACDVISDYVVRVLDVHDGARPYIVMELVGEHDRVRGEQVPGASAAVLRPRDLDEAVRWVRDVARGVHDAHLRDVFHRDLKPHNVLITPVTRRARIGDFGQATGDAHATGTPEYIAPELARTWGRKLAVSDDDREALVAIDVWGLGAIAYDLIAGRPPWHASAALNLEPWEVAASGAPPLPLARTLDGERVPPRLARVIAKAMADDPSARYASAAELANELDAYLARRPTSLDRSRLLRAQLFARRNPQLSLTASAALVMAALTLAAYIAVGELRARARTLQSEVASTESANGDLQARIAKTRDELATTEKALETRGKALASLERALADEENALRGVIDARDKALQHADAATKVLVDQLAVARSDRAAAEMGREMYEGFWRSARDEADRNAKDRDAAQKDRDAARSERDQLQRERDAARADRDELRAAQSRTEAEIARLKSAAAAQAAQLAELEHRLGASHAPTDAGVAFDASPDAR